MTWFNKLILRHFLRFCPSQSSVVEQRLARRSGLQLLLHAVPVYLWNEAGVSLENLRADRKQKIPNLTVPACEKRLKETGIIVPRTSAALMWRHGAISREFLWKNPLLQKENRLYFCSNVVENTSRLDISTGLKLRLKQFIGLINWNNQLI